MRSILNAKGQKKLSAVASAIRTMLFMQRYESDLRAKEDKLKVGGAILEWWMQQ